MRKDSVVEFGRPEEVRDAFTAYIREGAQRLIAQAVQVELEEFLAGFAGQTDESGRGAVVRNGYLPQRSILTGIGAIEVRVPKVRSRTESAAVFRSSLVPTYVRRARSMDAALPWLYLHGVSTGDMSEALAVLVGPQAAGLSAAVVSRLKSGWQKEYEAWCRSTLGKERWVYLWADGIYSGLRGEEQRLWSYCQIWCMPRASGGDPAGLLMTRSTPFGLHLHSIAELHTVKHFREPLESA
jgi:transposase-like protein